MAKPSVKNIEPAAMRFAASLRMPLPKGYSIDKSGAVSAAPTVDPNDSYRNMILQMYQQEQILEELTCIRRWVAFFGIATILALVVVVIL